MFRRKRTKSKGGFRILSRLVIILLIITSLILGLSLIFPLDYYEYIERYSEEYSLDPLLVASIINVESKYRMDAVSAKNARGLMQIGPSTGQWAGQELNIENYNHNMLFIPELNIRIGTWYISKLKVEFGDDLDLILAAYNAGSGNVQKWLSDPQYSEDEANLDNIPFKETEDYLIRVKNNLRIYKLLYNNKISNSERFGNIYLQFLRSVREYIKNIGNSYGKGEII